MSALTILYQPFNLSSSRTAIPLNCDAKVWLFFEYGKPLGRKVRIKPFFAGIWSLFWVIRQVWRLESYICSSMWRCLSAHRVGRKRLSVSPPPDSVYRCPSIRYIATLRFGMSFSPASWNGCVGSMGIKNPRPWVSGGDVAKGICRGCWIQVTL